MAETKVTGNESRWSIDDEEEVGDSDEGEQDNSEEVGAVESSIISAEPRNSDSAPPLAEEVKGHERGDQDKEKPESSVANLRGGESSPPHSEAKGDHSDGEDEGSIEIPGLPSPTSSAESPSTRSANQENETEDNLMSALDISTIKMAVQSGNPKAVDDLMERLTDTLAVDELTTTYGGHPYSHFSADGDNLFKGTSPILHAARSGNLAVFKSVMNAMQTKLSREQVKEMLAKKNVEHQSLLSLAARSGSKDVLEGVVLAIQQEFTEYEFKEMLAKTDMDGVSPLGMAARSGSKDVLEHVLSVIRQELSENEVKNLLSGRGPLFNDSNLLHLAIGTEKVEMFQAVMTTISDELAEEEVKELVSGRGGGYGDSNLLHTAISTEKVEMFQAFMTTISDKLTEEEVKELISDRGAGYGRSDMLRVAITTEKVEMFQAVMTTISDKLTEEEVKELLSDRGAGYGRSDLLRVAITTEKVEMFQAVMTTISDKLTEEEVKELLSGRGGRHVCYSFLRAAITTKKVEMFQAVMTTISDKLTEEEVKELVSGRGGGYGDSNLLHTAISTKKVEMFQAVMITISDKLTKKEVKELLSGRGGGYGDLKLLRAAIETQKVEMFQAVMTTISDKLTKKEVKELVSGRGGGYGDSNLLHTAIETQKVEMFQAVMTTISDKLTKKEVKEIVSGRGGGYGDPNLLHTAISTKKVEMFQAVMTIIPDKLTKKELKKNILGKDGRYGDLKLLQKAIATWKVEMFQAVMTTISDKLTKKQVKKLISGEGDGGFKLLSTAIETASVEMFEVVMATISDKLTKKEVNDILVKKDIVGGSLLDRAARSGGRAILEHVRSVIILELSENEVKELTSGDGDGGFKWVSTAMGTKRVKISKAVTTTIPDKLIKEEGENQSEEEAGAGTGTERDRQSYTPTFPPLSCRKAAMKHGQPNTPGPLSENEDEINPKGIRKLLPGPPVQPDAGRDSSQSGENKPKTIDILKRGVLHFLPTFSLCQCLRVNQAICNSVRAYLTDVVVDAEKGQPWTVPVDMLTLAGDSSKLTSAEYRVSIEGNNEDLRHLNALLVPGPDFLDIDGEMHVSLSPVLRCRWKRHLPNGKAWKVSFSMHNIDGAEAGFVDAVSIFRRPNGSSEGAWTLVGNEVKMSDADQAFKDNEVAHATVTSFSDIIAAVKMADAGKRTRGYLTKPISGVKIMMWSRKVRLYNTSTKTLGYVQYLPTLLPTSRSGQVELPMVGGGAASSSDITPRDPNSPVDDGYIAPWPRDGSGGYQRTSDPIHECLDTKRNGWGICLVVFDEDGDDVRILRRIDCDAGRNIILLDGIHQRRTVSKSHLDKIQQHMQAGRVG